jgi:DNA-binding PadR family transcriptional regulator
VEKEWLKKIRTLANRLYRKGEILRKESLSQSNYINVIKFLEEMGLISGIAKDTKSDKKEIIYSLTENRAEMEVLRRRLFKFLQ